MTDDKFCVKCGKTLPSHAQFCSECGEPVPGSAADETRKKQMNEYEAMAKESSMNFNLMLLLIYGIPVLIYSVSMLLEADSLVNILLQNNDVINWMAEYNVTADQLKDYIVYVGCLLCASSAMALVSALLTFKRVYWIAAVALCLIASFLCVMSIFGMIMGLLVTWMLISSRDSFTS